MLKRNIFLPMGLIVLCPWAPLSARARVVETTAAPATHTNTGTCSGIGQKSCQKKVAHENQEAPPVPHKKAFQHHALSGSLALRWLDVGDLSFDPYNAQPILDIEDDKNRNIVFDFSVMYQYRPAPSYSFGLSFDRLQVSRTDIDLRYIPETTPYPDESTWYPIASDLNSTGNPQDLSNQPTAAGNYYDPESVGNRGYCYEFVARAYMFPSWHSDPFVQATLGWTHNRTAVHRNDQSRSIEESDKLWTWSVGFGSSYALSETLFLESSLQFRDQHGFDIKDEFRSYTSGETLTLTGQCEKYYSVDFKVTLRKTW